MFEEKENLRFEPAGQVPGSSIQASGDFTNQNFTRTGRLKIIRHRLKLRRINLRKEQCNASNANNVPETQEIINCGFDHVFMQILATNLARCLRCEKVIYREVIAHGRLR